VEAKFTTIEGSVYRYTGVTQVIHLSQHTFAVVQVVRDETGDGPNIFQETNVVNVRSVEVSTICPCH